MIKKIRLLLSNKAEKYRILRFEPFGYSFGMDSKESFLLNVTSNDDLQMFVGDDDKDIIITFEGYDETFELKIFSDDQEIQDGYNIG